LNQWSSIEPHSHFVKRCGKAVKNYSKVNS
jgi:hypothetical protein